MDKSAIKTDDTPLAAEYLLKAALTAEDLGKKEEALAFYNKIKVNYPTSTEAVEIDKYIYRLENAE